MNATLKTQADMAMCVGDEFSEMVTNFWQISKNKK